MNPLRKYIDIVNEANSISSHDILWHGTSEPVDVIQKHGLKGGRHHAVFLTDNPDLALEYGQTDQERTGNDTVTLVSVNVKMLDPRLLMGDLDHTTTEDWIESLKETDQCMYMGDIFPNQISNIEDYSD
jgi:hypothetical protein